MTDQEWESLKAEYGFSDEQRADVVQLEAAVQSTLAAIESCQQELLAMTDMTDIESQLGIIGTDVGNLQKDLGNTAALTTAGVTTAVGALNNIEGRLAGLELDPVTKTEVTTLIAIAKSEIEGGVPEAGNTLGKLYALITSVAASDVSFDNAAAGLQNLDATGVANAQQAIDALKRLSDTKAAASDLTQTQADLDIAEAAIIALQGKVDTTGTVSEAIATAKTALKDEILDGAGDAWDTLKELKAFIEANQGLIDGLETLAASKVSFTTDQTETITEEQGGIARANIRAAGKVEFDAFKAQVGGPIDANAYATSRNAARGYA